MKRILLLPNTNTLSHLSQALAIAGWLEADGVECHVGIAPARIAWAARHFPRCHAIPELWQVSGVPYPCLGWFSDRAHIERCLAAQEDLVRALKPSVAIGIFDFLLPAGARQVPRIGINGYCMLPIYGGVLGYDDRESPERAAQARTLQRFWAYAARAMAPALRRRGLPVPDRATEMLAGDVNLIYEIPEFWDAGPLPPGYSMMGPVGWDGWDGIGQVPAIPDRGTGPTILLNGGTLPAPYANTRTSLVPELLRRGARVWVSTGEGGACETADRLVCQPFFPPHASLGRVDLTLCTGGTGACHQNLAHRVPALVLPVQPEQATNGIRLERLRCGRVMAPPVVFTGRPTEYRQAIDDREVLRVVDEMLDRRADYRPHLERMAAALGGYCARTSIVRAVRALL